MLSAIRRLKYIYFSPSLDNFVFKLCYRWTVLLLLSFSFIVTCRLLFGDSFTCLSFSDLPFYHVNVKCYAETPYIEFARRPVAWRNGTAVVDASIQKLRRYQDYYPWINLLFLVHAFNFYLPHLLWKSYESGYLRRLTVGVQTFFDKEEKRGMELCYLAKYVLITGGRHKIYSSVYVLTEFLNYAAAQAQTVWLVHFFNVTGVPKSLSLEIKTWSDFKNFYFPSAGTCEISFPEWNRTHQVTCELPMNSLYMRMFLFLHAWYVIVTILCGVVLIYRIVLLLPSFRTFVMKSSTSLAERAVLKSLCSRMSYGDWLFLSRLQKTMTDIDFAQMVDKISILSQSKIELTDDNNRLSFFAENMRDSDSSSGTSPI